MSVATIPRTLAREVSATAGLLRLQGSVHAIRRLGGMTFFILRDRSGTIQVVTRGKDDLPLESIVEVFGRAQHDERAPGGVEIATEEITVLASPAAPLPFDISKPALAASLETVLDHRSLSLRHPSVRSLFRIVSALVAGFRRHLDVQGFTEIHTSKLVAAATEGGANVFRVDYGERPAFLAQSPQLYKQICVGAFERVFEVGPVYRNEPHETTRHLNEYTSLDVEMGFTDLDGLLELETELLAAMLQSVGAGAGDALDALGVTLPSITRIPRVHLAEARRRLGRAGRSYAPDDDLDPEGERILGQQMADEGHDFVFVTHYPAAARPFYALPDPENPGATLSFDLLFRGLEVTTGGMRIHNHAQLLASMARRGLAPDPFSGYLEAFACGMPPHGGFAIGLERLTAQLCGIQNIRWATLFPRDRRRLTP
ncbi:MAG: aspartate--tRNA(Asn) ligase [Armatimonadota bacterium]